MMWQNKRLLLIYSIVLVDIIAGSIMWPVWPQFVKGHARPELLLALGTALFIALQLFTAPLLGRWSDLKGRKPIFVITAAGTFLANLMLLPGNALAFFSNRGADGLTNGVYAAVRSAITDISSPKDLMRNMGLEGTIVSLGFILGPLLASAVVLGLQVAPSQMASTLVYTGIAVSFINIFLSLLFKETLKRPTSPAPHQQSTRQLLRQALHPVAHFKTIIKLNKTRKGLLNTVLLQLFLTMSLGYYHYLITFISLGQLQLSPLQISYFFTYFGLVFLVCSYVFYTYLVHKVAPAKFLAYMALAGIITHIGYALVGQSPTALYIIVTLDCVTIGLLPGLMDALISSYTEADDRGEIFGITQALNGLASFFTTLVYGGLSLLSLSLPFYWFALCLIPLLFAVQLLKNKAS